MSQPLFHSVRINFFSFFRIKIFFFCYFRNILEEARYKDRREKFFASITFRSMTPTSELRSYQDQIGMAEITNKQKEVIAENPDLRKMETGKITGDFVFTKSAQPPTNPVPKEKKE